MDYSNKLIAAIVAGFLSHVLFFIKGEHHNEVIKIINVHLILATTLILVESLSSGVKDGFITASSLVAAYVCTLISSIIVYRVFFHRLRKFPGPLLAATSKLWHVSRITDSKQYLMLDKLRESYGDFVRTGEPADRPCEIYAYVDIITSGPTELTIFHPDAVNAVHGPNSLCTKAAWYDHLLPLLSLGSTRAKGVHDERRRALNPMFTVKGKFSRIADSLSTVFTDKTITSHDRLRIPNLDIRPTARICNIKASLLKPDDSNTPMVLVLRI